MVSYINKLNNIMYVNFHSKIFLVLLLSISEYYYRMQVPTTRTAQFIV